MEPQNPNLNIFFPKYHVVVYGLYSNDEAFAVIPLCEDLDKEMMTEEKSYYRNTKVAALFFVESDL